MVAKPARSAAGPNFAASPSFLSTELNCAVRGLARWIDQADSHQNRLCGYTVQSECTVQYRGDLASQLIEFAPFRRRRKGVHSTAVSRRVECGGVLRSCRGPAVCAPTLSVVRLSAARGVSCASHLQFGAGSPRPVSFTASL